MFRSITHIGTNTYRLEDADFNCDVPISIKPAAGWVIPSKVAAIGLEYLKRQLPVSKNVTLYYLYVSALGTDISSKWLEQDKNIIDRYCPELEYGKKYYNCVCRQIKRALSEKHRRSN